MSPNDKSGETDDEKEEEETMAHLHAQAVLVCKERRLKKAPSDAQLEEAMRELKHQLRAARSDEERKKLHAGMAQLRLMYGNPGSPDACVDLHQINAVQLTASQTPSFTPAPGGDGLLLIW